MHNHAVNIFLPLQKQIRIIILITTIISSILIAILPLLSTPTYSKIDPYTSFYILIDIILIFIIILARSQLTVLLLSVASLTLNIEIIYLVFCLPNPSFLLYIYTKQMLLSTTFNSLNLTIANIFATTIYIFIRLTLYFNPFTYIAIFFELLLIYFLYVKIFFLIHQKFFHHLSSILIIEEKHFNNFITEMFQVPYCMLDTFLQPIYLSSIIEAKHSISNFDQLMNFIGQLKVKSVNQGLNQFLKIEQKSKQVKFLILKKQTFECFLRNPELNSLRQIYKSPLKKSEDKLNSSINDGIPLQDLIKLESTIRNFDHQDCYKVSVIECMWNHIQRLIVIIDKNEPIIIKNEELEQKYNEQINLNKQKDEVLANVTHDFKTPLNSMLAILDYLEKCYISYCLLYYIVNRLKKKQNIF